MHFSHFKVLLPGKKHAHAPVNMKKANLQDVALCCDMYSVIYAYIPILRRCCFLFSCSIIREIVFYIFILYQAQERQPQEPKRARVQPGATVQLTRKQFEWIQNTTVSNSMKRNGEYECL